ncbi:hypothetical protein ABWI00_15380 [Algihabitans albus]|uniref:hypothetical protein n=1 Tax=Algihabitans albus TaxID=2164067 RepID=UPI0035CFBA2D
MRSHDADFAICDLDSLCQCPQMVAPKSAVLSTHLLTGRHRHPAQMLRRQMLTYVLDRALRALGIDARLVPGRRQLGDALFQ